MKPSSFKAIEKKLEKKNLELMEIRESRKKLDDKEKEICAAIDKLQNQKVEIIFEQVKKEIKNENLEISSASVFAIVDALKNNKQILNAEGDSGEIEQNSNLAIKQSDTEDQSEKILSSHISLEDDLEQVSEYK